MAQPSEAARDTSMDELLEDALADFDEAEEEVQARLPAGKPCASLAETAQAPAPAAQSVMPPSIAAALDNEALMREAEELAAQLMDGLNLRDGEASANSSVEAAPLPDGLGGADGMEDTLAALARSAQKLTQEDDAGGGDAGAAACLELLKQLGEAGLEGDVGGANMGSGSSLGGGGDVAGLDGLLDNLVGQLLSKDVMLEPMVVLRDEFPKYLQEKGPSLSTEDLRRYEAQQRLVGQIIETYEKGGATATERVASLMQELQQCGPPPVEIAALPSAGGAGCVIS